MSLKTQVYGLIDETYKLCQDCAGTEILKKTLEEMQQRLNTPLRVAVVGIMKAGKSTFMNALLGENLLFTGNLETTYTVCWFKYAKEKYLTICFNDGTSIHTAFEDLEKWSVRAYEKENPRINDVTYIILHYPNEVLKQFEFIDTPGLNSVYGTDAQNTLNFLEIRGSEDTMQEASMADAVIYAFSRSAGGYDKELLDAFHKGASSSSSPINSVGILTKVDGGGIWDIYGDQTPVQAAESVAANVMADVNMKRLLFSTFPVCAKIVEGSTQLDESDWVVLSKLSHETKDDLADLLFDAELFATCEDEMFEVYGTRKQRKHLIDCIGQYGIVEICNQLNQGKTREEIPDILQGVCGIHAVKNMLLSHFGNRTFLIKSQFIFNKLRSLSKSIRLSEKKNDKLIHVCLQLEEKIDNLMSNVQTLKELKILQYYYNNQLQFVDQDELLDFLHITGEYGRSPEMKLGLEGLHSVAELELTAKEKINKWHAKASSFMMPGTYVDAATTIARSYEYMYYYLNALSEE